MSKRQRVDDLYRIRGSAGGRDKAGNEIDDREKVGRRRLPSSCGGVALPSLPTNPQNSGRCPIDVPWTRRESWRWSVAAFPLLAVPVSLIGTFAVMAALGFSLNNLSLFGLVLAIGIAVDDAIVVVENVERNIEQGLEPKAATRKATDEVGGAVVAVAAVLSAVFIPTAFISGITGQFYRQFAFDHRGLYLDLCISLPNPESGAGCAPPQGQGR
jgi:hypothetical protein